MKSQHTGIKRIIKAFSYSFKGLISAFKSEEAFRQELLMLIILLPINVLANVSVIEKLFMFSSLILILLMELTNTVIEVVIDRIGEDYHELSGKAKDIGSLLVLIAFINAFIAWFCILIN